MSLINSCTEDLSLKQVNEVCKSILFSEVDAIDNLRLFEPVDINQIVRVKGFYLGSNKGGGDFYYDADDTISTDNNFSVIITQLGKCWKRDISYGVDVYSAGYDAVKNNLSEVVNSIAAYLVSIAIDTGVSSLPTNTILIPQNIGGQPYKTKTIIVPSFLTLMFEGGVTLDFSASDQIGIQIDNSMFSGLNDAAISKEGCQIGGSTVITTNGGRVYIKGIGAALSSQGGIQLGNTGTGYLNAREVIVENANVFGFLSGIRIRSRDTYINEIRNVKFARNKHALLADDTTATNSGEKTTFVKCIFSDSDSDGIRINCSAQDFDFVSCHVDYNGGAAIKLSNSAAYCDLAFYGGHIEGIGSVLVSQEKQIAAAGPNKINFTNVKFDLRSAKNNKIWENRSLRQMFSANSRVYVNILNCSFGFQNSNATDYGTLISLKDNVSSNNVRLSMINNQSNYPEFLSSYSNALNPHLFNGPEGVDITSGADSATRISVISSGGSTVVYGAEDIDGLTPLEITSTQSTGTIQLVFDKKLYLTKQDAIYGMISVRPNSAVGNINVSCGLRGFNDYTFNVSSGLIVENFIGTSYDNTIDVLTYFKNGAIAKDKFVSTEPLQTSTYGSFISYSKPVIRLTGFVGTISVKLPAFWLKN